VILGVAKDDADMLTTRSFQDVDLITKLNENNHHRLFIYDMHGLYSRKSYVCGTQRASGIGGVKRAYKSTACSISEVTRAEYKGLYPALQQRKEGASLGAPLRDLRKED